MCPYLFRKWNPIAVQLFAFAFAFAVVRVFCWRGPNPTTAVVVVQELELGLILHLLHFLSCFFIQCVKIFIFESMASEEGRCDAASNQVQLHVETRKKCDE